jgi:hypothetical protein
MNSSLYDNTRTDPSHLTALPFAISTALVVWFATFEEAPLFLWLGALISTALAALISLALSRWGRFKGFGKTAWILVITCVAVTVLTVLTLWPLHFAFNLSEKSFDELASRSRAGESVTMPQRGGFYVIQKTELAHDGSVCPWTELSSSGNTGFIQCKSKSVPFSTFSGRALNESWHYITQE